MNNEQYIFISYAHKDATVVLSCVEAMKKNRISVWYDNGIEAGSEWPEYIAEKVMNCEKFVLFISKAYLESQNCKRELNFAISRKKEILSIFLEDVDLSPGMEMQLGTYQAIFRNRFANDAEFIGSLVREPFFNSCKLAEQKPAEPEIKPQSVVKDNSQEVKPEPEKTLPPLTEMFSDYFGGQQTVPQQPPKAPEKPLPLKNKTAASLLAILLGSFGAHKFYLGKPLAGVLYLVFSWTYIPGIIGFVEGVIMLAQSDKDFAKKHNCRLK